MARVPLSEPRANDWASRSDPVPAGPAVRKCPSPGATLVVGLGNPLRGDDGVGVHVAQALAAKALPPGVEVVDGGTGGLGIVNLIEGRRRVIFVDAADMGKSPGQFIRFTLDEACLLGADLSLSVHAAGLRDALRLAQALRMLPDKVIIFGVQPANLEWDSRLSPEVEAVLANLMSAVLAEAAPKNQQTRTKENTSMAKILMIDDDPDILTAIRIPLEASGHEFYTAMSGMEGLEKIKEIHPDLVILDVMMETATEGFQISLTLRDRSPSAEYAAYRDIPILMLTAIHTTTPLRFAPDEDYLPVDAFLDKSAEPDELLAKVDELLDSDRE